MNSEQGAWARFKRYFLCVYLAIASGALGLLLVGAMAHGKGWISFKWSSPSLDAIALFTWSQVLWLIQNSGEIVRVISFALLAWALFVAAMKIETVFNIVRTFNDARSPIAELRTSVDGVKTTANEFAASMGILKDASRVLNQHAPTLSELNDKLAALSQQVIGLQEEAVSQRTEAGETATGQDPNKREEKDEQNWQELRSIWRRNNQRLEGLINNRLAGARQRSYARMPRTDYASIIDKLKEHNVLSLSAHEASKQLHEIFMSYKPRNRIIPDKVIGDMRNLDQQLEALISVVDNPAIKDVNDRFDPLPSGAESPSEGSAACADAGASDDRSADQPRV